VIPERGDNLDRTASIGSQLVSGITTRDRNGNLGPSGSDERGR
jgi:hypothetical protein